MSLSLLGTAKAQEHMKHKFKNVLSVANLPGEASCYCGVHTPSFGCDNDCYFAL